VPEKNRYFVPSDWVLGVGLKFNCFEIPAVVWLATTTKLAEAP
jgi:hypothetical protein